MPIKKYVVEFVGTFLLTFAVIASFATGFPVATPVFAGLVVGMLVYTMGGVSGAHFNPAVTIALGTIKKITAQDALVYIFVQMAGAAVAMLLVRYFFNFDGVFAMADVDSAKVFLAEALGAFVLVFGITSIVLSDHAKDYSGLVIGGSLILGASMASRISFGAINPAVAMGIGSFSLVYVLAPIVGAVVAAQLVQWVLGKR